MANPWFSPYTTAPPDQGNLSSLLSPVGRFANDTLLDGSSPSPSTIPHSLTPREDFTLIEVILIAILGGILSLTTIIGNVMVMISFKLDKQLQTISNYFLLSLALADFLIGVISMPLYTMYLLLGFWPLGPFMCDTYLSIDYLNSNASVLNLLIISFDRYFRYVTHLNNGREATLFLSLKPL